MIKIGTPLPKSMAFYASLTIDMMLKETKHLMDVVSKERKQITTPPPPPPSPSFTEYLFGAKHCTPFSSVIFLIVKISQ